MTLYASNFGRSTWIVSSFIKVLLLATPLAHGASSDPWRAQWIACDGAEAPNGWFCFRREFKIDEPLRCGAARIACDSKYWLWLNGERLVFEGQLKRGPTPNATYFDRIDLSQELRPGANTIAILVWHFGKPGMSHNDSGRGALLFEMPTGADPLVSDKTWKGQPHPAYYTTVEPNPNWRLPESNVGFDATRDLSGWTQYRYDADDWPAAIEQGVPPIAPWGELVERPVPLWRDNGLRDYPSAPKLPSRSTGEPFVCRLPYNAQITPYLRVESVAGEKIDIRTDNYRGGGETNVRAEYLTGAGEQAYESLGWMNGHEVIYAIPAGVRVLELKFRETGYDCDLAGAFECSDPRLNTLWRKAQRTLYLEMRDGYFDCPDRERAQWWGDITLQLQQAFYALDRRSDQLTSKAILELAGWQQPTGLLFSPIPAGNWDKELPMQMLAAIGRFGFWEYYRHTGDRATIEQIYPAVNRYLALWSIGEDGLVIPRQGGWTWGDWGENKDLPLLYNAWYYLAIDGRRRMAELLGDKDQAREDRQLMTALGEAFNSAFWTEAGYRSPGHAGPCDDRGNALAVVAGIADANSGPTLIEVLTQQRHASPYMEKYVLEALFQLGDAEGAIQRMLDRYGPMIDAPTTTLWEGWGVGPKGYGGGSYNHAWSGGPLTLLSQYVAGIDPAEPGYASVSVRPRLGGLTWVRATVATPRGLLRVEARSTGASPQISTEAPQGVRLLMYQSASAH